MQDGRSNRESATRFPMRTSSKRHCRPDILASEHPNQSAQPVQFTSDLEYSLASLASFVVSATPASGTAIGLINNSDLVCRASAGDAPKVGARASLENTLSGECVRAAKELYCGDTAGVHPDVLPIRSVLLLPIGAGRDIRGVLALFSLEPQAFDDGALAIARSTAAMISLVLAPPCHLTDRATQSQSDAGFKPAELSSEFAARPAFKKTLYQLPCRRCGAYFPSTDVICEVCHTPV